MPQAKSLPHMRLETRLRGASRTKKVDGDIRTRDHIASPKRQHHTPAMADYDSDSSSGDNDIETNVLLGYASKEETSDEFSQLGGQPVCTHPPTQ